MARLIFANQTAIERIVPDIEATPYLDGGAGPVRLGVAVPLADGRYLMSHDFREADLDWIEAYADDPEISVEEDAN
jgi:hypothetical protein